MTLALPVIPPNERPDICGPCGGLCCKRSPGISLPGDWADTSGSLDEARIVAALASGEWVAERWWDHIVLRPAAVSETGDIQVDLGPDSFLSAHFYSGAGRCNLLNDAGCKLPFDQRPAQCRMSVPRESRDCRPPEDVGFRKDSDFQRAWDPHVEALERCISKAWSTDA